MIHADTARIVAGDVRCNITFNLGHETTETGVLNLEDRATRQAK
jgi:hypothetical protein